MSQPEPEIIEAEIVKDTDTTHAKQTILNAQVSPIPAERIRANEPPPWNTPHDHARPYKDTGGMFGGFLVLALGFLVTVFVLFVSICIILPFTLLMRILGIYKRN